MAASGQVLHQPATPASGPVPLYHEPDLATLVECKCGGTRWNVELDGAPFTDKDGRPAQRAKYTCTACDGSVHTHAVPRKG